LFGSLERGSKKAVWDYLLKAYDGKLLGINPVHVLHALDGILSPEDRLALRFKAQDACRINRLICDFELYSMSHNIPFTTDNIITIKKTAYGYGLCFKYNAISRNPAGCKYSRKESGTGRRCAGTRRPGYQSRLRQRS